MNDGIAENRRVALRLVAEVVVPVFLVVAVVALLLAGLVVGLVVAVVAGAALGAYLLRGGPGIADRAIGGANTDDPRLVNLVDGVGGAAGVPAPRLVVVEDDAPNAASWGLDPKAATLAVTSGLLGTLSRVELEGVVARELARIRRHDIRPATVAAAVLTVVGPIRPWADRVRAVAIGDGGLDADTQGVRITRYPPGLASALARVQPPHSSSPATAHLWLSADVHSPLEERIEALREL